MTWGAVFSNPLHKVGDIVTVTIDGRPVRCRIEAASVALAPGGELAPTGRYRLRRLDTGEMLLPRLLKNPPTIYRKCSCGETAHEYTGQRDPQGWPFYACRNCRRLVVRRGKQENRLRARAQIRALHHEAAIFRRAQDEEMAQRLEAEARELEQELR